MYKNQLIANVFGEMDTLAIDLLKQYQTTIRKEKIQLAEAAEASLNRLKETGELIFTSNSKTFQPYEETDEKINRNVLQLNRIENHNKLRHNFVGDRNVGSNAIPYAVKLERISEEITNNNDLLITDLKGIKIEPDVGEADSSIPEKNIVKIETHDASVQVELAESDNVFEQSTKKEIHSKTENLISPENSSSATNSRISIKSNENIQEQQNENSKKTFSKTSEQSITYQNANKDKASRNRRTALQHLRKQDVLSTRKAAKSMFASIAAPNDRMKENSWSKSENSDQERTMVSLQSVDEDTKKFLTPKLLSKTKVINPQSSASKILIRTETINTFSVNKQKFAEKEFTTSKLLSTPKVINQEFSTSKIPIDTETSNNFSENIHRSTEEELATSKLSSQHKLINTEFSSSKILIKTETINNSSVNKQRYTEKEITTSKLLNKAKVTNPYINNTFSTTGRLNEMVTISTSRAKVLGSKQLSHMVTRNKAKEEMQKNTRVKGKAVPKVKDTSESSSPKYTSNTNAIREQKTTAICDKKAGRHLNKEKNEHKTRPTKPSKTPNYPEIKKITSYDIEYSKQSTSQYESVNKEGKLLKDKESPCQQTVPKVANYYHSENDSPTYSDCELHPFPIREYSSSDMSSYDDELSFLPKWQQENVLRYTLNCMQYIDTEQKKFFMSMQSRTIDLQKVFPSIDRNLLKRTSSSIWSESDSNIFTHEE